MDNMRSKSIIIGNTRNIKLIENVAKAMIEYYSTGSFKKVLNGKSLILKYTNSLNSKVFRTIDYSKIDAISSIVSILGFPNNSLLSINIKLIK